MRIGRWSEAAEGKKVFSSSAFSSDESPCVSGQNGVSSLSLCSSLQMNAESFLTAKMRGLNGRLARDAQKEEKEDAPESAGGKEEKERKGEGRNEYFELRTTYERST